MAERPLAGRTVVVTREEPGELADRLRAEGADVVHVPLIEIVPLALEGPLAEALASIDRFTWLVVTSRAGAAVAGPAAASSPVRLAAVGAGTAAELAGAAGRPVEFVPTRQIGDALVAEFPPARPGDRVLIVQADLAPPTVGRGLADRGYDVSVVIGYSTRLRTPTAEEAAAARSADAVTFASGSAVRSWVAHMGAATPPVVAVIGPSTEAVAREVGIIPAAVATTYDVAGMVGAVLAAFAEGGGRE